VGLVTGVALAISGIGQPVALAAYAICAFVITGIVHEWVRGTRSRNRKGEIYPVAFGRLLVANRPRYGGYIVHLGIMMLAIGAIASSFYGVQRDFAMSVGDEASLGDYSFRYLGVDRFNYTDRQEEVVRLEVRSGDKYLGVMEPFRAYFPAFKIAATRGAIRSTPIEDFYVVPSEIQDDGQAVFRVLINPLVWWMWASGPVMLLGVVLGLSPQRLPAPARLRVPANTRMAGT
jgi:cytochrome c-type biogenesis protein CcmF